MLQDLLFICLLEASFFRPPHRSDGSCAVTLALSIKLDCAGTSRELQGAHSVGKEMLRGGPGASRQAAPAPGGSSPKRTGGTEAGTRRPQLCPSQLQC